jgi:hypothetical protein
MNPAKKLLIASGLALALWGMGYGLYYATFIEHQTLDRIGSSLANCFTLAAERNMPASDAALEASAEASYVYVRQVDAHSHWIGLGMLLILFGAAFHRVNLPLRVQLCLAWALVLGAIGFPLGVLLETADGDVGPQAIAVIGSALLILALAGVAIGFARPRAEKTAKASS